MFTGSVNLKRSVETNTKILNVSRSPIPKQLLFLGNPVAKVEVVGARGHQIPIIAGMESGGIFLAVAGNSRSQPTAQGIKYDKVTQTSVDSSCKYLGLRDFIIIYAEIPR